MNQNHKQEFKENIKASLHHFQAEIFDWLDESYKTLNISENIQITQTDISRLATANNPKELEIQIANIRDKFTKIWEQVKKTQNWVERNYDKQLKELFEIEAKEQEKKKEILEFMNTCGFDKLPKSITDRIIKELQSETITIPWLEMSRKNIDLANGHFGESGAFIDMEAWINIQAKTNMVKFMNKLISSNINEPLSVEAIVNWVSAIDPTKLQNQFIEAGVVGNMGWNYEKIMENLRKDGK